MRTCVGIADMYKCIRARTPGRDYIYIFVGTSLLYKPGRTGDQRRHTLIMRTGLTNTVYMSAHYTRIPTPVYICEYIYIYTRGRMGGY